MSVCSVLRVEPIRMYGRTDFTESSASCVAVADVNTMVGLAEEI